MTEKQIDLRSVLPVERHRTVFKTFDELESGSAFILVVGHDPKPLFNQFESQRGGTFDWKYTEQGPSVWKVRIEKIEDLKRETSEKEEGCCGICSK